MRILDIGGGFSSDSFPNTTGYVRSFLDESFGDLEVEVIAEPGRYFAQGALTVACGVLHGGMRLRTRRAMKHCICCI